jgi:hypothetical protein
MLMYRHRENWEMISRQKAACCFLKMLPVESKLRGEKGTELILMSGLKTYYKRMVILQWKQHFASLCVIYIFFDQDIIRLKHNRNKTSVCRIWLGLFPKCKKGKDGMHNSKHGCTRTLLAHLIRGLVEFYSGSGWIRLNKNIQIYIFVFCICIYI